MANNQIRKPRRKRADSKDMAVRDMMLAHRVIVPPPEFNLTEREDAIFHELIDELPRGEWTAHTIRIAAGLARDIHDRDQEKAAVRVEGTVVTAGNGTPLRNPRCVQIAALTQNIMATRRSLSLHARAKSGMDNAALARRREIQREHEANALDDDDLIARPSDEDLARRR
jgi:hypothetical protein